jgi:hypothetical protein
VSWIRSTTLLKNGKNVELDNSLTVVHQNIRGLRNKSEKLINPFEIDKINPHVLCFTEHHMVEQEMVYVIIGLMSLIIVR